MKVGQIWETYPQGGGSVLTVRLISVTPHQNFNLTPTRIQFCPVNKPWEIATMRAIEIQRNNWKLIADVDDSGFPIVPRDDKANATERTRRLVHSVRNQISDGTTNIELPVSMYIDEVRNALSKSRHELKELKLQGVQFGEDVEPAIGALTCAIVQLYYVIKRAKEAGS